MAKKENKTAMLENKPGVIFIGYQRAGSTFLRSYFSHHPEIQWTRTPDYFGSNEKFHSGQYLYCPENAASTGHKCVVDMYESLSVGYTWSDKFSRLEDRIFYTKRDLNGPFDSDYYYPDPGEIASRIKATLPEAKILIVLRNQVDWLRSNYLHIIIDLPKRNKQFSDYIGTRFGRCALFGGLYHETIKTYFDLFGKENVHVMLLEQVKEDRDDALKRLCRFLGVPFVPFPKENQRLNKGPGNRAGNGIKKLSRLGIGITRKNAGRLNLLTRLFGRLKMPGSDILTAKDKTFIRSFYAASNCHTARLLGIDPGKYGYPL